MSASSSSFGIALIAYVKAKSGKGDELAKLLADARRNAESDAEPDCTTYRPVRSTDDRDVFYVFERYTSQQALEHHRQQATLKALKEAGVVESMKLEYGEEIAGAES